MVALLLLAYCLNVPTLAKEIASEPPKEHPNGSIKESGELRIDNLFKLALSNRSDIYFLEQKLLTKTPNDERRPDDKPPKSYTKFFQINPSLLIQSARVTGAKAPAGCITELILSPYDCANDPFGIEMRRVFNEVTTKPGLWSRSKEEQLRTLYVTLIKLRSDLDSALNDYMGSDIQKRENGEAKLTELLSKSGFQQFHQDLLTFGRTRAHFARLTRASNLRHHFSGIDLELAEQRAKARPMLSDTLGRALMAELDKDIVEVSTSAQAKHLVVAPADSQELLTPLQGSADWHESSLRTQGKSRNPDPVEPEQLVLTDQLKHLEPPIDVEAITSSVVGNKNITPEEKAWRIAQLKDFFEKSMQRSPDILFALQRLKVRAQSAKMPPDRRAMNLSNDKEERQRGYDAVFDDTYPTTGRGITEPTQKSRKKFSQLEEAELISLYVMVEHSVDKLVDSLNLYVDGDTEQKAEAKQNLSDMLGSDQLKELDLRMRDRKLQVLLKIDVTGLSQEELEHYFKIAVNRSSDLWFVRHRISKLLPTAAQHCQVQTREEQEDLARKPVSETGVLIDSVVRGQGFYPERAVARMQEYFPELSNAAVGNQSTKSQLGPAELISLYNMFSNFANKFWDTYMAYLHPSTDPTRRLQARTSLESMLGTEAMAELDKLIEARKSK